MTKENRVNEIVRMRTVEGLTGAEISRKIDCSRQYVNQILRENGLIGYFRFWTEKSCIYPGLRQYLNDNKINAKALLTMLGYAPVNTANTNLKKKMRGDTMLKMRDILKIIEVTGMTFEELFM